MTDGTQTLSEQRVRRKQVPMQMTRDTARIQCRMLLLVRLPQWKFSSQKAAHFALKCVDVVTYRSLLLSRFWVYQSYKYSTVLVRPTKKRSLWALWQCHCEIKVALLAKWIILEIYMSFHDLFQWLAFDRVIQACGKGITIPLYHLEMKWLGQGHRELRLISSDSHNSCLGYIR